MISNLTREMGVQVLIASPMAFLIVPHGGVQEPFAPETSALLMELLNGCHLIKSHVQIASTGSCGHDRAVRSSPLHPYSLCPHL
jgi:hypothetical protein